MKLIEWKQSNEAVKAARNGEIIAFPTETVYGLGVIYDDKLAYDKLVKAKRRPPEKPFTLMLGDVSDIGKFAEIDSAANKLINKYMPGQFTLILKAKDCLPSWCVSSDGNVGLRIPDDQNVCDLIKSIGKPLLVPSANRSGEKPALIGGEVISTFGDEVAVVINGESIGTIPSTVVLLNKGWIHVLREGNIKEEEILKTIKE